MNREQRRNRRVPGGNSPRKTVVPPGREGAALQELMAGTIPVTGIAGFSLERARKEGIDPPPFVVVFDDQAYEVAPRLRELRELQHQIGTRELNGRTHVFHRWEVVTDPDRGTLGRLDVKMEAPIRLRADFLMVLDNCLDLLPVLTVPHWLCLAHADDVPASGGDLNLLAKHLIIVGHQPSTAITKLLEDLDHGTSLSPR